MATPHHVVAVVDDDNAICRALKRVLRSVGIEAETFNSGEALLDMLSSATSSVPGCIIAAHRGSLNVTSEEGDGTVFTARIPISTEPRQTKS